MRLVTAALFGAMFLVSWWVGAKTASVLIEVFVAVCNALLISWGLEHLRASRGVGKIKRSKE